MLWRTSPSELGCQTFHVSDNLFGALVRSAEHCFGDTDVFPVASFSESGLPARTVISGSPTLPASAQIFRSSSTFPSISCSMGVVIHPSADFAIHLKVFSLPPPPKRMGGRGGF